MIPGRPSTLGTQWEHILAPWSGRDNVTINGTIRRVRRTNEKRTINVARQLNDNVEDGEVTRDRVSVRLNRAASQSLAELLETTGASRADLVNRALQLYAFFDAELRDDQTVVLRDEHGNESIVTFIF